MLKHTRTAGLGALLLLAIAAAPLRSPEELIFLGNEAFRRGDNDGAKAFYEEAAKRTLDPGLVEFNQGVVAFQKQAQGSAEASFARCLEDADAPPERRGHALYNRGVCLLYRGDSVKALREAIACFEDSLDLIQNDEPFRVDARHNLELAKLLWKVAQDKDKNKKKEDLNRDEQTPDNPPPKPNTSKDKSETGDEELKQEPQNSGSNQSEVDKKKGTGRSRMDRKQMGQSQVATVEPQTGQNIQPMSPEETREWLKRLDQRLFGARMRENSILSGSVRPNLPDW